MSKTIKGYISVPILGIHEHLQELRRGVGLQKSKKGKGSYNRKVNKGGYDNE